MAKPNYTRYIVLGMLSTGPMTGYGIRKCVKELFSYLWDVGYGQIYPMLSRLEREGSATMRLELAGKGPVRKVYCITARGRDDLQRWLDGPETGEYELLRKMCFGSLIAPDAMAMKLRSYADKRGRDIAMMEAFLNGSGPGPEYGPNAPFYRLISELGLAYFREERAWCDRSIQLLSDHANDPQ